MATAKKTTKSVIAKKSLEATKTIPKTIKSTETITGTTAKEKQLKKATKNTEDAAKQYYRTVDEYYQKLKASLDRVFENHTTKIDGL